MDYRFSNKGTIHDSLDKVLLTEKVYTNRLKNPSVACKNLIVEIFTCFQPY